METSAQRAVIKILRLYQLTLSPDHSWVRARRLLGACRFQPTCSTYAIQAIERFGLMHGGWLAFKRLMRCNPFNAGGHDPCPGEPADSARTKNTINNFEA